MPWFSTVCVRIGTQATAFTPLRGVLDELVDEWGTDRVRSLAAGAASALSGLVPDLAESSVPGAGDIDDAVARLLDCAACVTHGRGWGRFTLPPWLNSRLV